MKTLKLLFLLSCLLYTSFAFSQEATLSSGEVTLNITRQKDNTYVLHSLLMAKNLMRVQSIILLY